jgi:hypothetical protein
MSKSLKKKSFMDYYNEDPAFREKHLKRMMEKVECPCTPGKLHTKCNLSKHKKTNVHKYWEEIQRLQQQLDEINSIMKKNYKYKK